MVIKGPWRYSSDDWLQCLKSLPSSRILKRVKYNILFCTFWTALWTYFFKSASAKMNFIKILSYPASVHSIVGTALGLLLVFRTNASYDRFWEGRKLWSTVVVACRDIISHAYVHLDKSFHKKIANLVISYSISLKQHIQGESIIAEFQPFLNDESDLEKVVTQRNAPNFLLRNLMVEVHTALKSCVSDPVVAAMYEKDFSSSFHALAGAAASCERIVKQPVPLAYTRHTSRFLSLYLLTLPLTLIPSLGWAAVPTMLAISWSFLSVQEIGLFIEDPFNKEYQIIPLNQLILVLRSDIAGTLLANIYIHTYIHTCIHTSVKFLVRWLCCRDIGRRYGLGVPGHGEVRYEDDNICEGQVSHARRQFLRLLLKSLDCRTHHNHLYCILCKYFSLSSIQYIYV